MSTQARDLLAAFDALPPDEQSAVAVEILRRSPNYGEVSEDTMAAAADELFQMYDAEEDADAAGPAA